MTFRTLIILTLLLFCAVTIDSQHICDLGANLPASENVDVISKRSNDAILEIPVVFHVVGNEELHDNIDTTRLANLIDYCNLIFRAKNESLINVRSEFESVIGVANIELKIEQVIYQESDTKFIKSILGSENNLEDAKQAAKGGSEPWDTERYLNIWICNVINTNGSENNFNSSYATPPRGAPGWPDFDLIQGVLIDDLVVLDRFYILPHELGHYLGLRHVMEITQNNCQDNDGIEDTPTCSRSPECSFRDSCPGGKTDMTENFMNPQALSCRMAFTKGQVSFMRSILEEFRPLLFHEIEGPDHETLPDLSIYPNIVRSEFTIEFRECNVKFVDLFFYDNNGHLIRTDRFATTKMEIIDISNFVSGAYYVCIKQNDKVDIKKIIKI